MWVTDPASTTIGNVLVEIEKAMTGSGGKGMSTVRNHFLFTIGVGASGTCILHAQKNLTACWCSPGPCLLNGKGTTPSQR